MHKRPHQDVLNLLHAHGINAPRVSCVNSVSAMTRLIRDGFGIGALPAPRYRVYRHGELSEEPLDIEHLWQDDLVAFAIGCSFSFEQPLLDAGIALRHIDLGRNVAMYQTNIDTRPTARLGGKLVVSMRPMKAAAAIQAIQITARMPNVHGAPVHIGDPTLIGIHSLSTPDYGDAVPIEADEIPVFWACGVTPQSVVQASRPPLCITHAPGACW